MPEINKDLQVLAMKLVPWKSQKQIWGLLFKQSSLEARAVSQTVFFPGKEIASVVVWGCLIT